MFKFLKKNKLITLLTSLCMLLLAGALMATTAWYTVQMEIDPPTSTNTSGILTSYFDSGTGASNDPYVITRPIHFYHLSYLQNSDYFGNSEPYFQIGKKNLNGSGNTDYRVYEYDENGSVVADSYVTSLNMDYYDGSGSYSKLTPIGTYSHPFKGHLNGANITVDNIHINGNGLNDIGVFGYVLDEATVHNVYFDNVDIDTGSPTHSPSGHAHADSKYNIGYIAGHIESEESFNHVFINNCEIKNSSAPSVAGKTHYGYFGMCDTASTPMTRDTYDEYRIQPSTVKTYMDGIYSGLGGKGVATRPGEVEYNASGTPFTDAFNKNALNNYDLKGTSSGATHNYSLGTIGHQGMDAVYDIRYDTSTPKKEMDEDTVVVPEGTTIDSINDAGTYMYWDSTNEVWKYYVISTSGSTVNLTFNVFTLSYEYNSTTYYLYYDTSTSSLKGSTTVPTTSNKNYWFCFKENLTNNDLGVTSFTNNDSTTSYYIYIPCDDVYVYITDNTTFNVGTATDVAGLSGTNGNTGSFSIDGVDSAIKWAGKYNSQNATYAFQANGTSVSQIRPVANNLATIFAFNGSSARVESSTETSSEFQLITDVSEILSGTQVGIASADYTKMMSTTQNTNNRGSVEPVDVEGDGTILSNETGTAVLTVTTRDNSGTTEYSLYDPSNSGYLYAASSSSNYLRTKAEESWWTISIDESANASVVSQENVSRDTMKYNSQFEIFACYSSGQSDIRIYKYFSTSGTLITANAAAIQYTVTGGGSITRTPYAAFYDEDVSASESFQSLTFARSRITWDFEHSQITVAPVGEAYWEKVTSTASVTDGDYLIVNESNGVAFNGGIDSESYDAISNKIDVTISASRIAYDSATENAKFTWNSTASTLKSKAGYYIGRTSSSTGINASASTAYTNTISFSGSDVVITASNNYVLRYNDSSGQDRFRYYSGNSVKAIQLYKLVIESSDPEYISDGVAAADANYNRTKIDVVGDATFKASSIGISSNLSNTKAISKWHSDNAFDGIGSKFYQTKYVGNSIVFFIPNQGTLDFGEIHIYCTSSSAPVFIKGTDPGRLGWESSIRFDDARIKCADDNTADANVWDYTLSLNRNNIFNLCYAALNSSGNIISCYDTDGAKVLPASNVGLNSISTFVIAISTPSASMDFSTINLKINHIAGTIANYSYVGYRSATYSSGTTTEDGEEFNNVTAASVIDREVLDYRIEMASSNRVNMKMVYNGTTNTYDLTFKCYSTTTVYVFNFDAERIKFYINDTTHASAPIYKSSYHNISVSGSTWWS